MTGMRRICVGVLLTLASFATGCNSELTSDSALGEVPTDEDIGQVEQPVYGGYSSTSNSFAAAILVSDTSKGSNYWGRIHCSGTVLRRTTTASLILTARHCVTSNSTVNGPLLPVTRLKVSTALNPGIWIAANDTTPAVVTHIFPMPAPADSPAYDMAVVRVGTSLPLTGTSVLALAAGPYSAVANKTLYGYGYGKYVPSDNLDLTQAGALRYTYGLKVVDSYQATYNFTNTGVNGAALGPGDSGCPTLTLSAYATSSATYLWYTLFGSFHGDGAGNGKAVTIAGHWDWIQSQLAFVYLARPQAITTNLALAATTPAAGGGLYLGLAGDSVRTRWAYIASSGEFRSGTTTGLCLTGSGSTVSLQYCNQTTSQQWDFEERAGARALRNRALSTCLSFGTFPGLTTCGSSNEFVFVVKSQA